MSTLEQAIERLYAAFAEIPKPKRIDGCSHCLNAKEIDKLLASRLCDISPSDLAPYASSAFLTVGDVGDYLYFLPRILEVSATDDSWWPDPEVTGRAIRATNPGLWPSSRREATESFLKVVIDTAIAIGEYHKIDGWLCAIARMEFDVRPYLQQVAKSSAAVLAYFEENASSLAQNRLVNSFWELPCAGHDAIVEWFYSDEIRKIPFDAYGFALERSS
jgi:hypothetical protein